MTELGMDTKHNPGQQQGWEIWWRVPGKVSSLTDPQEATSPLPGEIVMSVYP